MRRLFAIALAILAITASACLAQTSDQRDSSPRRPGDDSNWRQFFAGSSRDLFRIGDTFFGAPIFLKWPDKRVTLDVKDSGISELAGSLQEQTGIEFIVGEGVPSDLKVTIHVAAMRVRDFLDTLTSTTGMVYIPESRADEQISSPEEATSSKEIKLTVPTRSGLIEISKPQPVTHVTFVNPRAEGVVVNMGKVSVSLKNADPIKAVGNLVSQIKGASFVVMNLEDYLALQSPEQAEQIRKALTKTNRRKVTLELRNSEVSDALAQLSSAGNFYMTIPKPGSPSFLVIPDVTIVDQDALPSPSIEYWSPKVREAREQAICMEYTKEMLDALLKHAKENGGVLPDATQWIELIPMRNEYLENRMPGGRYQYSYGMNAYLSGVKLSSIKKPSETVLIFECDSYRGAGTEKDIIRTLRHPGGIVYGFADGSVRILAEKPNFKP